MALVCRSQVFDMAFVDAQSMMKGRQAVITPACFGIGPYITSDYAKILSFWAQGRSLHTLVFTDISIHVASAGAHTEIVQLLLAMEITLEAQGGDYSMAKVSP